jgi:ABC-type multidrug transport system permease subunit
MKNFLKKILIGIPVTGILFLIYWLVTGRYHIGEFIAIITIITFVIGMCYAIGILVNNIFGRND